MNTLTIAMEGNGRLCANCAHFHRHYIRAHYLIHEYAPIHIGHCDFPNLKDKYITDSCASFEARKKKEEQP